MPLSATEQETLIKKNLALIKGEEKRKPKFAIEAVNALAIFKGAYPEPQFVVADLLANGVTILGGRPKAGKSWLTLQIAISVAVGAALFAKHGTKAGRVTYCALEEPESRTHHRLHRLVTAQDSAGPMLSNIGFIYKLPALLAGGAALLDEYLTANPSVLLVIDTLLAVVQNRGSRDVMRSDYAEVNVLRQLADKHGVAILLVAHSRKMAADYHVDSIAGTSGLTAACDAIWSLKRKPDGTGSLEVTGREFESRTLGLRFNADTPFGWEKTGEGEEVETSESREDIITLLRDDAPLKPQDIARRLHKNESTTRRLLQKMYAADQVRKNSDGRYVLGVNVPDA